MFEFRLIENDNRERYREQILLSSFRLQLCLIDVLNDLYERVIQINRKNENCINYRQILIDEQIIKKKFFKDVSIETIFCSRITIYEYQTN